MERGFTDRQGRQWQVALSGRRTHYVRDELSLEFRRIEDDTRRYVRFAPRAAQAPELAFEQLTDPVLQSLLDASQPAWTSPEGGYRRG
jgi:hypothetical protein